MRCEITVSRSRRASLSDVDQGRGHTSQSYGLASGWLPRQRNRDAAAYQKRYEIRGCMSELVCVLYHPDDNEN